MAKTAKKEDPLEAARRRYLELPPPQDVTDPRRQAELAALRARERTKKVQSHRMRSEAKARARAKEEEMRVFHARLEDDKPVQKPLMGKPKAKPKLPTDTAPPEAMAPPEPLEKPTE